MLALVGMAMVELSRATVAPFCDCFFGTALGSRNWRFLLTRGVSPQVTCPTSLCLLRVALAPCFTCVGQPAGGTRSHSRCPEGLSRLLPRLTSGLFGFILLCFQGHNEV